MTGRQGLIARPAVWSHGGCAQGDFPAQRMIDSVPSVDPARKARLIEVGGKFYEICYSKVPRDWGTVAKTPSIIHSPSPSSTASARGACTWSPSCRMEVSPSGLIQVRRAWWDGLAEGRHRGCVRMRVPPFGFRLVDACTFA